MSAFGAFQINPQTSQFLSGVDQVRITNESPDRGLVAWRCWSASSYDPTTSTYLDDKVGTWAGLYSVEPKNTTTHNY